MGAKVQRPSNRSWSKWEAPENTQSLRFGVNRWTIFDGGMAEFCLAVRTGVVDPFSERIPGSGLHMFVNWREM